VSEVLAEYICLGLLFWLGFWFLRRFHGKDHGLVTARSGVVLRLRRRDENLGNVGGQRIELQRRLIRDWF
jgi:hypothetical protein